MSNINHPIANSTKEHYLKTVIMIQKRTASKNLEVIFKYIKNASVKPATKVSWLNAFIGIKKLDSAAITGNLSKFMELRDAIGMEIVEHRRNNNITDNQQEAIDNVTYDDLLNLDKQLFEKAQDPRAGIATVVKFLLYSIMVNYSIRNDLKEVFLTSNRSDLDKPINVIYIPKRGDDKAIFSLKHYKETKAHGPITIELADWILYGLRKLWALDPKRMYLIQTASGEPVDSAEISHRLKRITKAAFGIPLTSTILRKIIATHEVAPLIEKEKELAHNAGHSVRTQREIYVDNRQQL